MLAFLLTTCAQALNPAALAREALVEYRANERIAPDKVLAKVLRNNPCTDEERRAVADAFLGTAAPRPAFHERAAVLVGGVLKVPFHARPAMMRAMVV